MVASALPPSADPPSPWRLRSDAAAEPLIYDDICTELCPGLAEIILAMAAQSRQSHPSLNRGGWKSPETFFDYGNPEIVELHRTLIGMIGSRPLGWAMVNRLGSKHLRHQHKGAIVTMVYYVTAGDPLTPTVFECADGSELDVMPHPGRLVICQGETWHSVPPYEGSSPRITIAADFRR